MEANHQMQIHKQEEKLKNDQGKSHGVQQAHLTNPSSSPPSSSSSPSHEFSFTISLHPSSASKSKSTTTTPPHFAAIDLSPADEIFFHGHLLPLHLLSHFHIPPRTSANSLDSFTLPIKELSENNNNNDNNDETDDQYINIDNSDHHPSISQESTLLQRKLGQKSKSFSLFGRPRWRKTREKAYEYDQDQGPKRNKPKFDVSNVLKRYMRLIKPFISLRNYRRDDNNNNDDEEGDDDSPQKLPFSYSRNLKVRSKKGLRGRRGELFSAPASMSTSPTNSGLLVASGSVTPTSASDSTMEELQAAIQAAIAHCKKSIAAEDKNQAAVTT